MAASALVSPPAAPASVEIRKTDDAPLRRSMDAAYASAVSDKPLRCGACGAIVAFDRSERPEGETDAAFGERILRRHREACERRELLCCKPWCLRAATHNVTFSAIDLGGDACAEHAKSMTAYALDHKHEVKVKTLNAAPRCNIL